MRRLVALLLAALAAGCAAREGEPAPEPVPEAAREAFDLGVCDIIEAPVDVPVEAARATVPPGFTLRAQGDTVTVVLGGATCENGSRAFLAIPVEPEDERLRAPGVRHFFEPEHLVIEGDPFAAALARLRGNATPAARIDARAAPPQPTLVVEGDGWAHRVAGVGAAAAPAPEPLVGGVFREWFPANGGYGYLEATFGTEGARLGLVPSQVETGEGTLSRALMGERADSNAFVLESSAYAEATLGFVPYP